MEYWREYVVKSNVGREFVAGGIGGTAGIMASYPLDTVRVMQQHSGKGSVVRILRNVVAKEGPTALYRGMAAPLASIGVQNAVIFQSYTTFINMFSTSSISSNGPPSMTNVIIGGLGAGAVQSLVVGPIDLIKIRIQLQKDIGCHTTQNNKKLTPISVAKNILKMEGPRGICRGLGVTILRDTPAHGFYFGTYEFMKEKLQPSCRESGKENLSTMMISGGLAGMSSWLCNYPIDVIKTRLQAQTPSSLKYKGILDCGLKIIKEEGSIVLWRGLGATLVRAFVMNSAIFPTYQISLRLLTNN